MSRKPQLPTVSVVNLPAVPSKSVHAAFKQLADLADELLERYGQIRKASRDLWRFRDDDGAKSSWIALPDEADLTLDDDDRKAIARARALYEKLNPDDAYEPYKYDDDADEDTEGGKLKRSIIAERLAIMLAAFPSGQPATAEGFVRLLLEHVFNEDVSLVALHTACAQLESERASVPSISVVLTALREHEEAWGKRRAGIYDLPGLSYGALLDLKIAREKVAAVRSELALRNAESRAVAARNALVAKQTEAAKAAQEVAGAFERLMRAEADLDKARRDSAGAAVNPTEE